jgi:hypothetical protein
MFARWADLHPISGMMFMRWASLHPFLRDDVYEMGQFAPLSPRRFLSVKHDGRKNDEPLDGVLIKRVDV